MTDAPPIIRVWRYDGTSFLETGQIAAYSSLKWTPTFLDVGTWSITLPYEGQALTLLPDRLVTIDWRGVRSTWVITSFAPASDDATGQPTLTVTGQGAFAVLGWGLAWPQPTQPLSAQVPVTSADPASYGGPAEGVLRNVIADNLRDRLNLPITIGTNPGSGTTVHIRAQFQNILELVQLKAGLGGIAVDVGLVDSSPTRADLTVEFYTPSDRGGSIWLSSKVGTLASWAQQDTAPTATVVLVAGHKSGSTRTWAQVSTQGSRAAAVAWGGTREVYLSGPDTTDPDELTQAGLEALASGARTRSVTLTAAEAEGMRAFLHYNVGDVGNFELPTGDSVNAPITSIAVTVENSGDGPYNVQPTVGDPAAKDARQLMANTIRNIARSVRTLEKE